MTLYSVGALVADITFLALMVGVVVGIVFLLKAKAKNAGQPPMTANWYPDPADPELLRYFDGHSWTETTRPRDAPRG